jgi:serine/threonine protein kinase
MSPRIWDELKPDRLLPLNVQLGELLVSDRNRAVFRADYLDATENLCEVLVWLFLENEEYPGERVNRFLEGMYLEHPHILGYINAGTLPCEEGTLTYAITERSDAWAGPSLSAEETLPFTEHVLSALEYLHARNLVYCVLSPGTVVRVGTDWKLSDLSQLRVAGTEISDEILWLAATLDTCPPEAAGGVISPAWDVWALGQTLQKLLAGERANMLDPFRQVVLACLNVNPSSRPTLIQLSGLLHTTRSATPQSDISRAAKA